MTTTANAKTIKIIEPHNETGWITAVIQGRWVQAKVYDLPSTFGVRNGRVSKLAIGKTDKWDCELRFFDQMAYNYDRGLDFHNKDELPPDVLDAIVAELEMLPKRCA